MTSISKMIVSPQFLRSFRRWFYVSLVWQPFCRSVRYDFVKHDAARFWLGVWDDGALYIRPKGTPGVTRSLVYKLRSSTPASLGLPTWRGYQANFNSRCVADQTDTELFHRFLFSLGTRRAAWLRSKGCDCVARELKWKINLWPWILRWICGRGYILAWDFLLRSAGCHNWGVSPCPLFVTVKPQFKKGA